MRTITSFVLTPCFKKGVGPEEFLQCKGARELLSDRTFATDVGIRAVLAIAGHLQWSVVAFVMLGLFGTLLVQRAISTGPVQPVYLLGNDVEFGTKSIKYQ